MKHRGVMTVIILSIVTFGIYDLFWLWSVKKELNARTNVHVPTLWLLFAPMLVMIPLIILMVLMMPTDTQAADTTANAASTFAILLIQFLAVLAIIPITFYWFFKFSKAVSEYTHGELSTAINLLLLWALRFVGIAVMQDKFNDMIAANSAQPHPMAPQGPVSFTPPTPPPAPSAQ